MPKPAIEPLLTTEEFAALCRAPRSTVYTWIQSRRIESVKIGRRVLIPEREYTRLVQQNTRERV